MLASWHRDVQSVLPEAVHPVRNGAYLGVNYADLVPVLVEAIRELDTGIEELKVNLAQDEGDEELELEDESECATLTETVRQLKERVLSLSEKNAELRRQLRETARLTRDDHVYFVETAS